MIMNITLRVMPLGIAILLACSVQAQVVDPGPYQSICGDETFMQAVLGPGENGTWSVQDWERRFRRCERPDRGHEHRLRCQLLRMDRHRFIGNELRVVTIVAYDPGGCIADAGSDQSINDTSTGLEGSTYSAPCICAWAGDPNVAFGKPRRPPEHHGHRAFGRNEHPHLVVLQRPLLHGWIPLTDQVIIRGPKHLRCSGILRGATTCRA